MGIASSKHLASKRCEWTSTLYYTPDAKRPGTNPIEIDDDDTIEYFKRVEGTDDQILWVWTYKQNLSQVMPFAATQFCHEFVVVESTAHYWSFEMDTECIRVQRSKDEDSVIDLYRGEERLGTVNLVRGPCKGWRGYKIRHIFEWLYEENHLSERYRVLDSDCQHFAADIYAAIRYRSISLDH